MLHRACLRGPPTSYRAFFLELASAILSYCQGAHLQAVVTVQWLHPCLIWYALQWAERLLEGGGNEQWGDKWEERFKDGSGGKQVCTWHLFLPLRPSNYPPAGYGLQCCCSSHCSAYSVIAGWRLQ